MPNARLTSLVAAVLLATTLGSASAAVIPVVNPSFETLPAGGLPLGCGTGCAFSIDTIPGWTTTGQSGQFRPGPASGNFTYFNYVPDGTTVAYTNNGSISQVVGVGVLGVTYTLSVDVGYRKDITDTASIELVIGAVASTPILFPPQFTGDWVTFTVSDTVSSFNAGGLISIVLASGVAQGDWDNVRLTSNAAEVPEPASLALLGAGILGLAGLRRRL